MGYACPVCDTPQMDAEHLANHLALTAILGNDPHEDWLDEHVPDWEGLDEATLGERAAEHAEETEFPQVFEDTVHDDHEHDDHERSGALFDDDGPTSPERVAAERGARARTHAAPDAEVEQVMEEARELTERRRANASGEGDDATDASDGDPDESDDESE